MNARTRVTELVPWQTHYVLIGVTDKKNIFLFGRISYVMLSTLRVFLFISFLGKDCNSSLVKLIKRSKSYYPCIYFAACSHCASCFLTLNLEATVPTTVHVSNQLIGLCINMYLWKKVIQGLLCFVSYAIFHNKIKHHHLSTCAFKPLGRHFDSHLIAKVRQ